MKKDCYCSPLFNKSLPVKQYTNGSLSSTRNTILTVLKSSYLEYHIRHLKQSFISRGNTLGDCYYWEFQYSYLVYDMYTAAISGLELGDTRRAEKNFDILVSITHLLTKNTLSEEDLDRINQEIEYIKSNYNIVENNLSNIKNKQSNYWWK